MGGQTLLERIVRKVVFYMEECKCDRGLMERIECLPRGLKKFFSKKKFCRKFSKNFSNFFAWNRVTVFQLVHLEHQRCVPPPPPWNALMVFHSNPPPFFRFFPKKEIAKFSKNGGGSKNTYTIFLVFVVNHITEPGEKKIFFCKVYFFSIFTPFGY